MSFQTPAVLCKKAAFLCLLFTLGSLLTGAQAASFKCSKAKTKQEKLICQNDSLSQLDDTLAIVYKNLLQVSYSDPRDIISGQADWLRMVRDTCGTVSTLSTAIAARIAELISSSTAAKKSRESDTCPWKWVKCRAEWYPQLLNPSKREKINEINGAIAYLFCGDNTSNDYQPCEGGSIEKSVEFSSKGIFSISIIGNYVPCDNPIEAEIHPKEPQAAHVSYDMKTGQEILFSKLFREWQKDKQKILEVVFKNASNEEDSSDVSCNAVKWALEKYRKKEKEHGHDEPLKICFRDDGLMVASGVLVRFRECSPSALVDYQDLIPFAAPNSVLMRFKK
jgi:uncharacterized protein